MERNAPVKVYDAWNSIQAQFLCNLLSDAGISARVASDAVQNVVGRVPFQKATCPVLVAATDVDKARSVVAEYDRKLADHSRGGKCRAEVCPHHGALSNLWVEEDGGWGFLIVRKKAQSLA